MNIEPKELISKGYELLETLEHKELIPFVKKYLGKKTSVSNLYYSVNIILFLIGLIIFLLNLDKKELSTGNWVYHYFLGFSISFLLVPLHEFIHVIAYKSQGALHTSYDANLKKFYFMALADQFVANKKEFTIVALAPFLVISSMALILIFWVNYPWKVTILGVLLCHTAMCSGDFGLLSYFTHHKDKDIVTYDVVQEKRTYFYGRVRPTKTI